MRLLSLMFIYAFFSTAGALSCHVCQSLSCEQTISASCPEQNMCATAGLKYTAFGNTAQQTLKVCASSSLCQVVGTQEFSLNIDFVSAQASISCCNTDNCNQRSPANISGDQAVNGLKCMAINPTQQQTTVECKGKENRCLAAGLSVYSNQYSAYGCVSDNMCQAATLLNELPNLDFVNITREPTCCEIDLCNAPTSLQPSTPHPPTTSNAVYTKQHVTYLLIGHLVLTLLKKL